MNDFHRLAVAAVEEEIPGVAHTVVFDVPEALRNTFGWQAGQHVTLRFRIGDKDVRRSYSISSAPNADDPLRITVKRVEGGLVSNYVNDSIAPGSWVDVMAPFGGFVLQPEPRGRRTCYLIGAGSGITPLYAMLRTILVAEPWSVVHLLYGNRDTDSILFFGELSRLEEDHPNRLTIRHMLSRPRWGSPCWRKGRIDAAAIEAWIAENPPYAQDAQYFVCGPGRMNRTVVSALTDMDVPTSRIHMESFGGSTDVDDTVAGVAAAAEISLGGRRAEVPVAAGQTLLAAARAAGMEPPFSCEAGVCGACRANLVEGTIHMRSKAALTEADLANGSVLTCQAVATSPRVRIRYGL